MRIGAFGDYINFCIKHLVVQDDKVIDEVSRDIYLRFALNYTVPAVHVNGGWDCAIESVDLRQGSVAEKKGEGLFVTVICDNVVSGRRHKDIKSYLANGRRLWYSFESLFVGLHDPMPYQDAFVAINNAAGINSPSLYRAGHVQAHNVHSKTFL